MDPVSAALQVIASINNVITALINKASSTEIDTLIASHLKHRERMEAILDGFVAKVLHITLPPVV